MSTVTVPEPTAAGSPAERLRLTTAAVRVMLRWMGAHRCLTPEQKSQAAEPFDAEGTFLSARKKLLDTRHEAFRAVTAVRTKVIGYWKGVSLPYPEPGVRLVRQDQIDGFNVRMTELRADLDEAVARLDQHYDELRETAQRRLGQLFDVRDYPDRLEGLFGIDWSFITVEPPDYLLQLNPALYEQEQNRVAARFEQAVTLAEEAFLTEFGRLVAHLTERLTAGSDGEQKVFRNTAVLNLVEFFDRFRELNVRSNGQLDALVEQAQRAVRGIEPQELRDNDALRRDIGARLAQVQSAVDDMMVDMPRRRLIRPGHARNGGVDDSAR